MISKRRKTPTPTSRSTTTDKKSFTSPRNVLLRKRKIWQALFLLIPIGSICFLIYLTPNLRSNNIIQQVQDATIASNIKRQEWSQRAQQAFDQGRQAFQNGHIALKDRLMKHALGTNVQKLDQYEMFYNAPLTPNGFPKIIHQTWKTENTPSILSLYSLKCQEKNPGWVYNLWTDDDINTYITNHFSWFLPVFNTYTKPLHRADVARYFILMKFGGFYLDLDTECAVPFDDFLADPILNTTDVIIGVEPKQHSAWHYNGRAILCNAIMGSKAEHPFWANLAPYLGYYQKARDDRPVFSTGPVMLTDFWESVQGSYTKVKILDSEYFYPFVDTPEGKWRPCDEKHAKKAITCHRWIHTGEGGLNDGTMPDTVMAELKAWLLEYGPKHFRSEIDKCLGWRQTSDCRPDGEREIMEDKSCTALIKNGLSGYCECDGKKRFPFGCFHKDLICSELCSGRTSYGDIFDNLIGNEGDKNTKAR